MVIFLLKELNEVYLFGQDHFIRAIPYVDNDRKNGRVYEFRPYTKYVGNWLTGWKKVPEGPLPYSKMDIFHTPDFYKHFLKNNAKFGASYDPGCCYWQHFFRNGTYYKVLLRCFMLLFRVRISCCVVLGCYCAVYVLIYAILLSIVVVCCCFALLFCIVSHYVVVLCALFFCAVFCSLVLFCAVLHVLCSLVLLCCFALCCVAFCVLLCCFVFSCVVLCSLVLLCAALLCFVAVR